MKKPQKKEFKELEKTLGFALPIDEFFSGQAEQPVIDAVELHKKLQVPKDKAMRDFIREKYGEDFLNKLEKWIFVE